MQSVDLAKEKGMLIGEGSLRYVVEAVLDDTENKASTLRAILIKKRTK